MLTKNFRIEEFYTHDGTEIPEEFLPHVTELAENLQVLRYLTGSPITIINCYWHLEDGKKILAVDIKVSGHTSLEVFNLIDDLIAGGDMKEGGLGLYDDFVRYNIRGIKTRWDERKSSVMLTKNFKLSEFACHDGTPVPGKFRKNVQKAADNIQVLRDYLTTPENPNPRTTVISGYRHPAYNKRVKGARFSKHKKAMAGDLGIEGYTPLEVYTAIIFLIKSKKMKNGGVGLYDTFVHYDTRLIKARWDKRKGRKRWYQRKKK